MIVPAADKKIAFFDAESQFLEQNEAFNIERQPTVIESLLMGVDAVESQV